MSNGGDVAGLGTQRFTRAEVAEAAGLESESARRFWRAMGFPDAGDDERVFTQGDVDALRNLAVLLQEDRAAEDVALQLTRVTGQSLARVADAQVAAIRDRVVQLVPDAEDALLQAAVTASRPMLESSLLYVWRRHLAAAVQRASRTGSAASSVAGTAVGFADLVGFTAISQELDDHELAAMVGRFEALAVDTIAVEGGRVVKMIGDEVMFVSDTPASALVIAMRIAAACRADEVIPDARVGLAWGRVVSREGDYYGPTVNLAHRIVSVAFPGTVVVSDELHSYFEQHSSFEQEQAPALEFRPLRLRALKGIGRVRLWVVRGTADAQARTGTLAPGPGRATPPT